ncbi:MAG: alkaline phosphatase family protein [Thermoplasmata archaeon]|nr:alkaline phosphatase family protein [Thermoplasmata archaeon]
MPSPVSALIILDGLSDSIAAGAPSPTPLEAAHTPNLDRLAGIGQLGHVVVVGPGIAPESDAGVLALLGYDPIRDSPGRGVLEAMGSGVDLAPGDVALRLNFATIDGEGTIVDSRVGRNLSTREASELARTLTSADLLAADGIRAEVRSTVGHRGILWLHPASGGPLSPEISNSDPFYDRVGGLGSARANATPRVREAEPLAAAPAARRTAEAVNRFLAAAGGVLAGHPVNARRALAGQPIANALLVRNAGALPTHPPQPFAERYGRRGAALTEMPVERGIARLLGLRDEHVGPMGRDREAALRERAQIARRLLAEEPFVYVHLKGPDEPGHDGDAAGKQAIIEAIDRAFFGPFLDGLDLSLVRLAVTADHATPAAKKGHSDDPVPLLLVRARLAPASPGASRFDERRAAEGSLGARRGGDVLPLLFGGTPPA